MNFVHVGVDEICEWTSCTRGHFIVSYKLRGYEKYLAAILGGAKK